MADIQINVDGGTSKRLLTAGKYCDKDIVVTATGGAAEPVIQPLEVTSNGTYTAPAGVDGYSPVTVNVSGGGGETYGSLYINVSNPPYITLIKTNGEAEIVYSQDYGSKIENVQFVDMTVSMSGNPVAINGQSTLLAERQVGFSEFKRVYKLSGDCVLNSQDSGGGGIN